MAKITDPLTELSRILAKAENNASPQEAEMAMERAIRLSERYGIDLAFARLHQASQVRQKPIKERIKVGDPMRQGNDHLMELFVDIALVNDCRCTISGEAVRKEQGHWRYDEWQADEYRGLLAEGYTEEEARAEVGQGNVYVSPWKKASSIYANIHGFPADIEVTKKVYAVAVAQMVAQANHGIATGVHFAHHLNAKTWRANFYQGFIAGLTNRLLTAKREAISEAEVEHGDGTALVLADKTKEVEDFYKAENPQFYRADGEDKQNKATFKGGSASKNSYLAQDAGAQAAAKVNLHEGGREIGSGVKGVLGS